MRWEQGPTRQPAEARGNIQELAAGFGLVVYLPNGDAVPEAEEQLPGKGVYVPWNSDHDNGNQYVPDHEALPEQEFTDNDLVKIEIHLEPWTDWFAIAGLRLGLRTESDRLRVWRGRTGGAENLMVDPSTTSECWFSLLEETQADFADLWVEGYQQSMATHDAPLTVVLSDGQSRELELDRAGFTVIYPDLSPIQEIQGDEFAFISSNVMPDLRAQVRPPQLQGFVHWDLVIEYGRVNRQDYDTYAEWCGAAEQWAMRDAFGEDRRGGKATLRWSVAGATAYQDRVFHIRGENPTVAEAEARIVASGIWYAPYIARHESDHATQGRFYAQFNEIGSWGPEWSDYRACPNFGGPVEGWGVMQLDTPTPGAQELWSWTANVDEGLARMREHYDLAEDWMQRQIGFQQSQRPDLPLENEVFTWAEVTFQEGTGRTPTDACAVWRYNGQGDRWPIWWVDWVPDFADRHWDWDDDDWYLGRVCQEVNQ